eukprot:2161790-Prymnesium_polylepis.1
MGSHTVFGMGSHTVFGMGSYAVFGMGSHTGVGPRWKHALRAGRTRHFVAWRAVAAEGAS